MNKIARQIFLMLAIVILSSIIIVYFTDVATAQMIQHPINTSLDGSNENYLKRIQNTNNSLELGGFLSYVNLDMGLKVKYPSDWSPPIERREFSDIASQDIDTISFFPRAENNAKNFTTNYYNVFVSKSEKNFTDKFPTVVKLSRYKTDENASLAEIVDQRINYYKNTIWLYPDFHLINSNSTYLGISLSHVLNFSYDRPDFETIINNKEIITLQNDYVYSISYSAEEEEYSTYLPFIIEMIKSLEIFDTLQYEKVFNNNSAGVILQYPNQPAWKPAEIDGHNINLMEESPFFMRDFILSIYPYQKPLVNLTNELIGQYKNNIPSFESIENNTAEEISTTDENKTAYKITFVYYDKRINVNVKAIQVYTIIDNNAYIFTYMIDPIFYNDYLPIIEEVVDSVKIMEFLPVPEKNKFAYFNSAYGFKVNQPLDWQVVDNGNIVQFLPPPDQNYSFNYFQIITRPSTNLKLSELVQRDILNAIKLNNNNVFEFMRSNISTTKDAQQEYEIEYEIGDYNTLGNYRLHTNGNYYIILYSANAADYYYYLPIVKEMIESFEVKQDSKARLLTGLKVGKVPAGIAVNPTTNMVYVVNSISDTVSVLNGSNDIITEIEVGKGPSGIAVNPTTDIIYVSNKDSDSVSVIDGSKNTKIKDISVGPNPLLIAVNQFTNIVYVADSSSRDIYVVDGSNNNITEKIQTGGGIANDLGIGIALNQFTNRIYVANPATNNITVIDGHTNRIITNISIPSDYRNDDPLPNDIAVNPFTNLAYVIHSGYNAISAIDLSHNVKLGHTIFFKGSLNSLAVNPFIDKIYATDYSLDAIYVIKPSSFESPSDKDNHIKVIKVDSLPLHLAVNPNNNIIYASNSLSDTVTMINGTENKVMFGVTFDLNSSNSTSVLCNGIKISDNDHLIYNNGTEMTCNTKQDNFFSPIISSLWSGSSSSTSPVHKFVVDKHMMLEGKFEDLSKTLEKLGPYISIFMLTSVVAVASIPSLLAKIRRDKDLLLIDRRQPSLLSKTEIIGINASVIAGVLVFLSILEGFERSQQAQISIITADIVFPFAISAIVAVNNHERFATRLMIAGFINLMISVILIAIMKV